MSKNSKVTVKDWAHVARVAGNHNIRFPTNWRLEAFLAEIQSALVVETGDGPSVGSRKDDVSADEATAP